jgi:hypothetical protein
VVDALPEYGSSTFPPFNAVKMGVTCPKVTLPGPRYLDSTKATGGGASRNGVLVLLVYLESSSTQKSNLIGSATDALRAVARRALATGPVNDEPFSANLSMGGRL